MSIFDKLKNTAQQTITTAVQTAGSKRETFTFAALPESLPNCRRSPKPVSTRRSKRRR